jgi:hypothetical protein
MTVDQKGFGSIYSSSVNPLVLRLKSYRFVEIQIKGNLQCERHIKAGDIFRGNPAHDRCPWYIHQ